jgi:hypothetical protein
VSKLAIACETRLASSPGEFSLLSIVAEDLWKMLEALSKKSQRRMAAVAYLTSEERVRFEEGDVLVVDASDDAIGGGLTSARMLARLRRRGVSLYSFPGLHAKVLVFDDRVFVGSSNLSSNSERLLEAGIVTDSVKAMAEAEFLIRSLRGHPGATEVDEVFISRAMTIPVTRRPPPSRRPKAPLARASAHCVWLAGIYRSNESHPDEDVVEATSTRIAREARISKDAISCIRGERSWRFALDCRPGQSVIQVWRTSLEAVQPRYVYRPVTILEREVHRQGTRVYVRDTDERIPWGAFTKMWKSLGRKRLPGRNTATILNHATATAIENSWPTRR